MWYDYSYDYAILADRIAEKRSYEFADEKQAEEYRYAAGIDTEVLQDFGPSVLLQVGEHRQ